MIYCPMMAVLAGSSCPAAPLSGVGPLHDHVLVIPVQHVQLQNVSFSCLNIVQSSIAGLVDSCSCCY